MVEFLWLFMSKLARLDSPQGAVQPETAVTPWLRSIPVRYAAISLVAALCPLLVVGGTYDRYATNLLDTLTGERLDRRLTAISGRLTDFLDVRPSQRDTLVHHPDLVSLLGQSRSVEDHPAVRTVVEFEAEQTAYDAV